jgi:type I restriction enzyme M protein
MPNDLADLVIYGDKDEELKQPYFVFECKRADVSDAEFAQSIEQACGNRANLGAPFCGTIAALTRRLLRFDNFPPGERDKNDLADVPFRYNKPPAWRFYKSGFRLLPDGKKEPADDLPAIPREDLLFLSSENEPT